MKKPELEALGLTYEQIRAVQRIHGADMAQLAKKNAPASNDHTRTAVAAMLPMIHSPLHLRQLLANVNHFYHIETRPERKEEPECNTKPVQIEEPTVPEPETVEQEDAT